jgi:CO/xanthine dehydrogenase Mo-binding subunit
MNRLAEALGMDPVEIRLRNVLHDDSLLSVGTPIPGGVSLQQVVEQCAQQSVELREAALKSSESDPYLRRGYGFACAFKNVGFSFGAEEQCWATVELHGEADIERVVLHHAGADVGQGGHTAFAQMAAEALGVPVDIVHLIASDTAYTGNSGSVSASRMTFMAGNSIIGACEQAMEKWRQEERPAIATYQYLAPPTSMFDAQTGHSKPNFAYGYVAQAATVEVDTETGHVRIQEVVSANDVGKAINPQLIKGQIEGAVVQAAGYAILENFVDTDGYVQTRNLSTYLIPTVLDIPERVQSLILEYPDPNGPWGVRGMAEMPFLTIAPAVIAAVHQATGVWFYEFPLTPERVLRGLGKLPPKG